MAWNESVVTVSGIAMVTELINGGKLNITRAEISENTVDPAALALQTVLLSPLNVPVEISKKEELPNGLNLCVQIRNTGSVGSHRMKQLGIYAKTETTEEKLFAILQDQIGEDIPSEAEYPKFLLEYNSVIAISNTDRITVTINPMSVFITLEHLNSILKDYLIESETIQGLIEHTKDNGKHITSEERDKWNANTKTEFERSLASGTKIGTLTIDGQKIDIYCAPQSPDTKYTLTKSGNTIMLNGSDGSQTSVADTNTDTKYSIGKVGNTIILYGTDGSQTSVADSDTNTDTKYSIGKVGSTIILYGSDGSQTSVADSNTTYSDATPSNKGLMTAADKQKLDGIPAGGMNAYAGTFTIDAAAKNSPVKITTASRPKLAQIHSNNFSSSFSGDQIRHYTTNGKYYLSGSSNAYIEFQNDGMTISWAANTGLGTTTHEYFILC